MEMFYRHMIDLLESIDDAYNKARYMPCLVLLYSGIDVAASLESPDDAVGKRFMEWVDRYMLNHGALGCSSADLYGARCGVVHTFTPESDYFKKGRACQVAYAFGNTDVNKLRTAAQLGGLDKIVSIHVHDLIDAFRNGFADFYEEVQNDPARLQKVETSAGIWSQVQPPEFFDMYIDLKQT
jgi:hypothetical protein